MTALRYCWLALFGFFALAADAAEKPAKFRVDDGRIVDGQGKEFILRGVNVEGLNYGWPGDVAKEVDLIAGTWGFNAIRVNCRLLEQRAGSSYSVLADLDRIVEAFTAKKIVVIFEFHDRTGRYYEGDALATLSETVADMAKAYRGNPYVWFNVMNEPGEADSLQRIDQWVALHQEVIGAIRKKAKSDAIILVDGQFWGQDIGLWKAATSFPVERSSILARGSDLLKSGGKKVANIAFSIHPYDQWSKGDEAQTRALLSDFVTQARERKLCVIFGEWGSGVDPGDRYFPTLAKVLPEVANELKVGRLAWAWRGGDPFKLTKEGGGHLIQLDAAGKPSNLSWFGELVWNDLHRERSKKR